MRKPSEYAKAIVGGLISALTTLVPFVNDGVSLEEALGTLLAGLLGFAGVFWTKNANPEPPLPPAPDLPFQRDLGEASTRTLALVALAISVVAVLVFLGFVL